MDHHKSHWEVSHPRRDGRITYRDLLNALNELDGEQLDCVVIVEDSWGSCSYAQLSICGDGHSTLSEDHPVVYVPPDSHID